MEIVRDQSGIALRHAVQPEELSEATRIDDAELIDLLRVGGQLILTDPVVTEEPPD